MEELLELLTGLDFLLLLLHLFRWCLLRLIVLLVAHLRDERRDLEERSLKVKQGLHRWGTGRELEDRLLDDLCLKLLCGATFQVLVELEQTLH